MKLRKLGVLLMNTTVQSVSTIEDGPRFVKKCFGDPQIVFQAIELGKKEGLDALIAPEWSLMDGNKEVRAYDLQEKEAILAELKEHSKGSRMLIFPGTAVYYTGRGLRNLLPVVANGKIIYKYNKKLDGGTTDFLPKGKQAALDEYDDRIKYPTFLPGRGAGVFKYEGARIGVEVCADGGLLKCETNAKDLDLQVFVSCGANSTRSVLKPGGVFVYADGYANDRDYKKSAVARIYKESGEGIHISEMDPKPVKSYNIDGTNQVAILQVYTTKYKAPVCLDCRDAISMRAAYERN